MLCQWIVGRKFIFDLLTVEDEDATLPLHTVSWPRRTVSSVGHLFVLTFKCVVCMYVFCSLLVRLQVHNVSLPVCI